MNEITRNPLCWPNNVPRTLPQLRSRPRFDLKSNEASIQMVLQEINRLNQQYWNFKDESVVVSTNVPLRRDGLPYSNEQQPADTGVAVYFNLRFVRNGKWHYRHTVLSCDKWNRVAYNLTAIAKDIEAQRARDRWGATNIEQAYRGYLAIPEQCGGKSWWDFLGVESTASEKEIKEAFRVLAMKAHPDKGGEKVAWNKLSEAYEEALARFR
jgi:DnaJ domain